MSKYYIKILDNVLDNLVSFKILDNLVFVKVLHSVVKTLNDLILAKIFDGIFCQNVRQYSSSKH